MKKLFFNKKINSWELPPLLLMVLLSPPMLWGQGTFEKSPDQILEANRSIIRDWKGQAQIIYIDALNDYEDEVPIGVPTHAQIIYAEYSSSTIKKVSVNPGGDVVRIHDMKILEDTLYFCGYSRNIGSPDSRGFLGYISIPDAFNGMDDVHILWFNDNNTSRYITGGSYTSGGDTNEFGESGNFCLNRPNRIEVFNVDNGIHIICLGQWGGDHNFSNSRSCFIADIVRSFDRAYLSNPWWYYISLGNGMEAFNDITVTDNYVATVANKPDGGCVYMRLFDKPREVAMLSDGARDPQMFRANNHGQFLHHYIYNWSTSGSSMYKFPRIIHTDGDSFALALHTLSTVGRPNDFGITVNHFSIIDMLEAINPALVVDGPIAIDWPISIPGEYIDPGFDDGGPYEDIEGPDPIGIETGIVPIDPNMITRNVPIAYSRKINQNLVDYPATDNHRLQDIAYDEQFHKVLVLDYNAYCNFIPEREMMGIHAFDIDNPSEPVDRYSPKQQPRTLRSLDMYNHEPFFIYSGFEDIYVPSNPNINYNLIFGKTELNNPFYCFDQEPLETFDPRASCIWDENGFLESFRVDREKNYWSGGLLYTIYAFSYQDCSLSVETISSNYICK